MIFQPIVVPKHYNCVGCNKFVSPLIPRLYQHIIESDACLSHYRQFNLQNPKNEYRFLGEKPVCIECNSVENALGIHNCVNKMQNILTMRPVYECCMCLTPSFSENGAKNHRDHCFKSIELLNKYIEQFRPGVYIYLQCPNCYRRFSAEPEFNEHVTNCYKCRECGELFQSIVSYTHHEFARIFCNKCNLHYCTQQLYDQHYQNCSKCELCQRTFENIAGLNEHKEFRVACLNCPLSFCNYTLRDEHLKDCFVCVHCSGLFNRSEFVRHTTDNKLMFTCHRCLCICGSEQTLFEHTINIQYCSLCYRYFCNHQLYNMHNAEIRTCAWCDKPYCNVELWNEHEKCCMYRQFKCDRCSKIFKTSDELTQHKNVCGTVPPTQIIDYSTYPCSLCGEKCTSPTMLFDHHKEFHSDISRIKCPACYMEPAVVAFPSHFDKTHIRRSEGIIGNVEAAINQMCTKGRRPIPHDSLIYKCPSCENSRFEDFYKLQFHMKRLHSLEDKVKCPTCEIDICARNFSSHCKSHGGRIRTFQCEFCPEKFITMASCKKHMKTHRPTE